MWGQKKSGSRAVRGVKSLMQGFSAIIIVISMAAIIMGGLTALAHFKTTVAQILTSDVEPTGAVGQAIATAADNFISDQLTAGNASQLQSGLDCYGLFTDKSPEQLLSGFINRQTNEDYLQLAEQALTDALPNDTSGTPYVTERVRNCFNLAMLGG